MRLDGILLGSWGFLAFASPSLAAPLTCDAFRDRVNGALMASGDKDAEAPNFKAGVTSPEGTRRYTWDTASLSGTMNCGPANQFAEFYISLEFASKDRFAEQIKRFVTLQGAAICALVKADPQGCADQGKLVLQDALKQMGAAYTHGSRNPSGLSDRTLVLNVNMESTAAPSLVTFTIGPGRGSTVDDTRREIASTSSPAALTK